MQTNTNDPENLQQMYSNRTGIKHVNNMRTGINMRTNMRSELFNMRTNMRSELFNMRTNMRSVLSLLAMLAGLYSSSFSMLNLL